MLEDLTPLWISLRTALVATLLAAIFGIATAHWMLTYRGKCRGLIDGVLTLPLVLPPTVVGFLLLLLLGKNSPIGQWLDRLGLSIIFTWTAAVIAATVVAFPLMYKAVLGAFEQVDLSLIGSARTLGASEWRIFWQILLPLAWPGILAGTVLAFARALGEFGATLMVGGSIPGVTQTIPIVIFFAAEAGRMGVALAWVLLMVAVSLGVIAGMNYGQPGQFSGRSPALPPTPAQSWVKRGFDWVYFGQFTESLRGARKPEIVVVLPPIPLATSPPTSLATSPAATAELVVKIKKQVAGFALDVGFKAGREPLGLLGASGSGKSMALRCIAGLETPSEGRIVLNGRVLFDAHKRINVPSCDRKVGLVFQNYALFPHLSVAQNIAFGMQAVPKPQRMTEVVKYLDKIDLTGLGDRYPHQLSGGQQQRVALVRAIATNPDILLLDEPLSALDTYLRSHIERHLIEVLSQYPGVTLLVTHKLEEAYRICANLLVLSEGKILAEGTKKEIFERPSTFEVARVTECKNFSQSRPISDRQVEALDWGCLLEVHQPMPLNLSHVGLRAHHVEFSLDAKQSNTFPGWLATTTETQHQVTLYLKLHSLPQSPRDYHLQAEIYREKWDVLKKCPPPWHIRLDPDRLILMSSTAAQTN